MRWSRASAPIAKSSSAAPPRRSPQWHCTMLASSRNCARCSRIVIRARDGAQRTRSAWSRLEDALDLPRCPRSSRRLRAAMATCAGRRPNSSCARGKIIATPSASDSSSWREHGNLNARKMALYCLRDVGGPREELLAVAENCCGDHPSSPQDGGAVVDRRASRIPAIARPSWRFACSKTIPMLACGDAPRSHSGIWRIGRRA